MPAGAHPSVVAPLPLLLYPTAALLMAGQSRNACTTMGHNCPLREGHCDRGGRQAARSTRPAFLNCEAGSFCTYVLAHTCFCSNLDSQNACCFKILRISSEIPHLNPGPVPWLRSARGGRGTSGILTAIPMGSQAACEQTVPHKQEGKTEFTFVGSLL